MSKSFSKRLRDGLYGAILHRAPRHVLKEEMARRQIMAAAGVYGEFIDGNHFADEKALNTSGESGGITGALVAAIRAVAKPTDLMLLPGERRSARTNYGQIVGIPEERILTAGVHADMDFSWNFEDSPPAAIPPVDLIASHAMIEHLLDPYRHVHDCHTLLKPGGCMIFHTVMPGFKYHRYPVDCLRFFPDWFEEIARRLGTKVAWRSLDSNAFIVYALRKAEQ